MLPGAPLDLRSKVLNTGTVKWFNAAKGFGFIQPENGGADAFVHISAVERAGLDNLNEGDRVEYELRLSGPRGGGLDPHRLRLPGDETEHQAQPERRPAEPAPPAETRHLPHTQHGSPIRDSGSRPTWRSPPYRD